MPTNTKIARSAKAGQFAAVPLGKSKAAKFAAVEGLALSPDSEELEVTLRARGLKGDAYREAAAASISSQRKR
jgi:hypothetical protein